MPLEAVVVIMDNSEYNRNGDFPPSRWESQQDAANNIIQHKLSSNPENTIGLMSMAGARVDTCLTQTSNDQEIMSVMSQIPINGYSQFFAAVKVAQLSLKHRKNKTQRMRIMAFCGHPLLEGLD